MTINRSQANHRQIIGKSQARATLLIPMQSPRLSSRWNGSLRWFRWVPVLLLLGLWLGSCQELRFPDRLDLSDYQPLASQTGATLYARRGREPAQAQYLQVIDLKQTAIDHILESPTKFGENQGLYYRGEHRSDSPTFPMLSIEQVINDYQQQHGAAVFSVINCAFFEQYDASTQLSFPLKGNGNLLTGGSSPYGPIENPAHPRYRDIQLLALTWDNQGQASLSPYSPVTGNPLSDKTISNAIVSYRYQDHPSILLGGNPSNRYHVIGTYHSTSTDTPASPSNSLATTAATPAPLPAEANSGDDILVILTVMGDTLMDAGRALHQIGIKGELMTIDGGTSTLLYNPQQGTLSTPNPWQRPGMAGSFRQLPHYLGVRHRQPSSPPKPAGKAHPTAVPAANRSELLRSAPLPSP
jgi:hypothetical protein